MKKLKRIFTGFCTAAAIMSFSIPVLAASPITGWRSEGTYTGYPYISWNEYGRTLGGTVAAENRKTNKLVDTKNGYGTDKLYLRTPENKLYSETIYRGYYRTYYK
ncbi:hypothetical protein [Clostridium baratii]|uniref:hypothetical protein n=1 Tax=Clostridium baratii TaxID=1561 RepID=UPI0029076A70|nr:hypothetical protein [Clostridium baratii]MDU4912873.1 hypothetical protein [Clostridium baratii]